MNGLISRMGKECGYYRKYVMCMTLKELSNVSGVNLKTLSSFEHGHSRNIDILYVYLNNLTMEQKKELLNTVFVEVIENGK